MGKRSNMNPFTKKIAKELQLPEQQVENTLKLLDDGCTIPFIARYRKEKTGGLDEVQIAAISNWNDRLKELFKRKETVCRTINELDKMTPELQQRIDNCWDATELEDIYLPYRPKRRTRAQVARERGLEPLAQWIMLQRGGLRQQIDSLLPTLEEQLTEEEAIAGAKDIIAEEISENERARQQLRRIFRREAVISSRVVKSKQDEDSAAKYSDYFHFSEQLRRCSGNRLLAMRRAEHEGIVRVCISVDDEQAIENLQRQFVKGTGDSSDLVAEAAADAYKRLLEPSIENEFAASSKQQADQEAIQVFVDNLRQLLLAAPLGQKRVMAVDPGYANGCKIACLDAQGNLLHHEIIYPHPPKRFYGQATVAVINMMKKYKVEAVAIGNGTASRETLSFIKEAIDLFL